jgi:hypothetical protein
MTFHSWRGFPNEESPCTAAVAAPRRWVQVETTSCETETAILPRNLSA